MKPLLRFPLTVLLLALVLIVLTGNNLRAAAIQTVLVTVDEQGHSQYNIVGLGTGSLTAVVGQDPGPGGLSNALIYKFDSGLSVAVTAGDVFLTDGLGGSTSDVVRFNAPGADIPFSNLVFYSLPTGSLLGDTGFPTQNYTNQKTLVENEITGTFYTPAVGEPGFVSGFNFIYQLYSGPAEVPNGVPETGSTLLLLGFALIGMTTLQRAVRLPQRVRVRRVDS